MKRLFSLFLICAICISVAACAVSCNSGKDTSDGYSITYILNGGTNSEENPSHYNRESVTLASPSRAAFDFLGWYEDEALTVPVSVIDAKRKSDITIYAKWSDAKIDALIYDPNGGIGYSTVMALSVGDTVTLNESSFTKSGCRFAGWSDSPDGEVLYAAKDEYTLTKSSARVLYAVWEEIEGADKGLSLDAEIDYTPFYVQDNLAFSMDFFGVTDDRNRTNPLLGGKSYGDVNATADTRFVAESSNYTPFINHAVGGIAISGGTAKVVSPWSFQNWYSDYTRKLGTGSLADMRTSLPTENVAEISEINKVYYVTYNDGTSEAFSTVTESGATVYVRNTLVDGVTDYYIHNGKWAKKNYVSKWSDNCLILGTNSTMYIDGLRAYISSGVEDYTVQVISSYESENATGQVYMLGMARFSVGPAGSGKKLSFRNMTRAYNGIGSTKADFTPFTTDADWYGINDNTFTFDRSYSTSDGVGTTNYEIYVNGKSYSTLTQETTGVDGTLKIGEGQNTKLYAIRVYSDILTQEEILQNHFVDIAKLYGLTLTQYADEGEDKKAEIHAAFADTRLEGESAPELQARLDSFFEHEMQEGIFHIVFKANYGEFGTLSEQYAIEGAATPTPQIQLGGSDFLGWATSPDGEVEYKANTPVVASEDLTLYAIWTHNSYEISYDANGGKLADNVTPPDSYVANTAILELPTPERKGYIFCGWYTSEDYTEAISKIDYGLGKDLRLIAGWVKDTDRLFELNIPDESESMVGKYDPDFTDNANVLDRFMQAKNELPTEISVISPLDVSSYLISNQTQYYVSPDGDDANAGTIDSPLATVSRALSLVRGAGGAIIWVRGGEYSLSSPISINSTHSGTAVSPLIISAYGDETPVFYTSKSLSPSDFSPIDAQNDRKASLIAKEHQANVVRVNVKELSWTDNDMGEISKSGTPSLFINGELCEIARYPNKGEELLYITRAIDTGSVTARDGSSLYRGWILRVQNWKKWSDANGESYDWNVTYQHPNSYQYISLYETEAAAIADARKLQAAIDAGKAPYTDSYGNLNLDYGWSIGMIDFTPCLWENDGNIWYYGNVFSGWEYGYYNIKEFSVINKSITSVGGSAYGANVSSNSPTGHNDYYLFNAIEALDSPGEWYLDRETGELYIYKTEDFDTATITYSSTKTVDAFSASYAENVIINGIGIDMTSGNGISVANCENIVIQNCNITNTGKNGINIDYSTHCAAIYNDVSRAGGTMIVAVYTSAARRLTPTLNVIQNNYCHSPLESKQSGISLGGYRTVVSHNELQDCRISFSGSCECIVEYNDVRGGSKYESDAGMIYLNGYYHLGNHVRYNYLHDWGTPGNGVYFDDLSSFNYAYYNIMDTSTKVHTKATGFCYTSTGHYNVFYGNILVGRSVDRINESAIYLNERASLGYRWEGLSAAFVSTYTLGYDLEKVAKRFPELIVYLEKMQTHTEERKESGYTRNALEIYLRSPANNIVKNNVVVGTTTLFNQPPLTETDGKVTPSTDYVGENYHATSYEGIFEDFRSGDFTLLDEAKAEITQAIPDFVPLSTEKCGIVRN